MNSAERKSASCSKQQTADRPLSLATSSWSAKERSSTESASCRSRPTASSSKPRRRTKQVASGGRSSLLKKGTVPFPRVVFPQQIDDNRVPPNIRGQISEFG